LALSIDHDLKITPDWGNGSSDIFNLDFIRCQRSNAKTRPLVAIRVHHYDVPASDSSFPAYFEVVNRRIAALFKRTVDALHNYVMDLAALLESGFSQRLVDWFR
jgi:hypothetical protein